MAPGMHAGRLRVHAVAGVLFSLGTPETVLVSDS